MRRSTQFSLVPGRAMLPSLLASGPLTASWWAEGPPRTSSRGRWREVQRARRRGARSGPPRCNRDSRAPRASVRVCVRAASRRRGVARARCVHGVSSWACARTLSSASSDTPSIMSSRPYPRAATPRPAPPRRPERQWRRAEASEERVRPDPDIVADRRRLHLRSVFGFGSSCVRWPVGPRVAPAPFTLSKVQQKGTGTTDITFLFCKY